MLVTAEELLGRARKKEENKKFKVYISELDREIECSVVSRNEYLEVLYSKPKDEDAEIIYLSCPIFRDEKIIKALKCEMDPVSVVGKILSHQTIYALTKTILEKSDIEIGAISKYVKILEDDIKN